MTDRCVECGGPLQGRGVSGVCWKCTEKRMRYESNPFASKKRAKKDQVVIKPPEFHQLVDNLNSLIQLCHPDKHENSASSKRITEWLIKVKNKHGKKRSR